MFGDVTITPNEVVSVQLPASRGLIGLRVTGAVVEDPHAPDTMKHALRSWGSRGILDRSSGSQAPAEELGDGAIEFCVEGHAVDARSIAADLRREPGERLAARREKHEMIGALDDAVLHRLREFLSDDRGVPGVWRHSIVFRTP